MVESIIAQKNIRDNALEINDYIKDLHKWEKNIKNKEKFPKKEKPIPPIRTISNNEEKEKEKEPMILLKEKGNEYFRSGEYSKAIECYSSSINKCEKEDILAASYSNRALCYYKLLKYSQCEKDCTKALSYNIFNIKIKSLLKRGFCRKYQNKSTAALDDFKAVLRLDNKNSIAKQEISYLNSILKIESIPIPPLPERHVIIKDISDKSKDDSTLKF